MYLSLLRTERFDVMLTAGVGYKHHSGFTASARYNLGMSKLTVILMVKVNTQLLYIIFQVGWAIRKII